MEVFTIGQVAKICDVAPATVGKWFDSGKLKGYRLPGGRGRRIPKEYLIEFLKKHNMPLGDLENKVLIVSQDQILTERLSQQLTKASFKTEMVPNSFDAGFKTNDFHPDCIIVDFSIGRAEALQICRSLRANAETSSVIIVALLPDDNSSSNFSHLSINETFRKPVDSALLSQRIKTLFEPKEELI